MKRPGTMVLGLALLACGCGGNRSLPGEDGFIIRIGSSDVVLSANLFLDSQLSVWAQLSNPPIMRLGADGRPAGQIARDVLVSDDLRTWTLVIRDDLVWSDGRPVTAGDVRFTLEYTRDRYPPAVWMREAGAAVEILPPDRVVVRLNSPASRLDFDLCTYRLLPSHVWSAVENPREYTNTGRNIGCGPFVIKSIDLNRGVLAFEKNPHWKGPEPAAEGVEVHFFRNRDVMGMALKRGRIDITCDYASSFPYANLDVFNGDNAFEILESPNSGLYFLGFNLRRAPGSDPLFRRALVKAVDHAEILRLILLGHGDIPGPGLLPPGTLYYQDKPRLEYAPDWSRARLEEAGYIDRDGDGLREDPDGRRLRLSLLVNPAKFGALRLSELIRDYFGRVGLDVEVRTAENAAWIRFKDDYRYDLLLSRTSPWGIQMHAGWATGYFDSRRSGEGVLHTVDDPAFLDLCDALLSTRDEDRLAFHAGRVQDWYAENLPALPLFWSRNVTPFHIRLEGWTQDPITGIYNLDSFLKVRRR